MTVRALCFFVVVAGCASPIVGAECLPDFAACGDRCVDLDTSRANCGACGFVCDALSVCAAGVCVPFVDAGPDANRDAGDAGDVGDVGPGDGSFDGDKPDTGDASMDVGDADVGGGDGGVPVCTCDIGESCCSSRCVRPERDPANCGGCGIRCAADEFCAAGSCADVCDPPLTLCSGLCVNTLTDRDHCGSCGNRCASGICRDGACVSSTEGHVVLIGHDYRVGRVGQNYLAGNAVFIAFGEVDVLAYEGDAIGFAISGVDAAIEQVAARARRTWTRTEPPSASEVPLFLDQADAFVVYAQSGGDDMGLRRLGREWATALRSFLRRGGVIVVFDGGGSHSGTWQILDEAGLLDAGGRSDVSGDELMVVSRGDAVARLVPRDYAAENMSVAFDMAPDGTVVVEHPTGPVVIHQVLSP